MGFSLNSCKVEFEVLEGKLVELMARIVPKNHFIQRSTQRYPQNLKLKNYTKSQKTESKEQIQEMEIRLGTT